MRSYKCRLTQNDGWDSNVSARQFHENAFIDSIVWPRLILFYSSLRTRVYGLNRRSI